MKLNIYSIYDQAAKAYTSPFFMHNHGLAIRAFSDQVNSQTENQIQKHPEQFTLFHIGEYNDETGNIESLTNIKSLGKGHEYLENKSFDKLEDLYNKFEALLIEVDTPKLKEVK